LDTPPANGRLLATEEAKLSLELASQIRNKLVDAYQEISRIQI
jgi:flagellar hook-basal body complex protein FliE